MIVGQIGDAPRLAVELAPLLQRIFGSRAKIITAKVVKNEPDYRVAVLRLRHPALRVVVKLAGPHPPFPCPFERTAKLYQMVGAQTEIPMPEIYAVDVSRREEPWSYLVKSYITGSEWARLVPALAEAERAAAYELLGRAAAQLHAIRYPAFGEISAGGEVIEPLPLAEALARRARVWIRDPRLCGFFLDTLGRHAALFAAAGEASLTHEDLHKFNILFTRRAGRLKIATLLDFDKAWAGPAESDLARLDLWRGMTAPAFWQAYRSLRPIPAEFDRRKLIYQLLWCLEYNRPTPEHRVDTRQVCAALGVEWDI